jgi:F0F1-type ATP synthase membrane subunit c/vacuolar-type H+-ATPase subunit K
MPAGAAAVITAIGGAIGASGLVGSGKVRDFVTGVAKQPEPPKPKFDAPVIISIVVGALGLLVGIIVLVRK